MGRNIFDEISFLYAKFDQAEREWLNRFNDLENHYTNAVRDFTASLPKTPSVALSAGELVDISSSIVIGGLGLAGGPAVIAVPIVLGLKKLASMVDGNVAPPAPDNTIVKSRIDQVRQAFKDTTEHIGRQIVKVMEKAKNLGGGPAGREIDETIGQLLLSPIWYPPAATVTRNPGLTSAIEMRLWFNYFRRLMKEPPGALLGRYGYEYAPMWERMQKKGISAGLEFSQRPGPDFKPIWMPHGNLYDAFKKLNEFGEKNRILKLNHTYPRQVQDYLMGSKIKFIIDLGRAIFTGQAPEEGLLPVSTLTWADVTI